MSKGWWNFRFGKARTTLKGGGGSGEPTTREVVQGVRWGLGGSGYSAAEETSRAISPAAIKSGNAGAASDRRRRPWAGDSISSTPEEIAPAQVCRGAGRAKSPL